MRGFDGFHEIARYVGVRKATNSSKHLETHTESPLIMLLRGSFSSNEGVAGCQCGGPAKGPSSGV